MSTKKSVVVIPAFLLRGIVVGVAQSLQDAGMPDRDAIRSIKAPELAKDVLIALRSFNIKTLTAELRVLWQLGPDRYLDNFKKEL